MKKYENIIILKNTTTEEEQENIELKAKEIFGRENVVTEYLGEKQLAYPIHYYKEIHKKGIYMQLNIKGYYEDIQTLERYYKENNNVLKFITVKVDDFDDAVKKQFDAKNFPYYDELKNLEKVIYDTCYMLLELDGKEDAFTEREITEIAQEIADNDELNDLIDTLVRDKLDVLD